MNEELAMDSIVYPAVNLPSAPDRARALQPLLDAHGAEIDRRHEATPEVVEALFANDMLRLLLPRSLGGQEIHLVDFCKTNEVIAWSDASIGWFVNQSNVCVASCAAAMAPETVLSIFSGPRTGLAWGAKHNQSKAIRVDGGYRLTGTWSFASGSRHTTWIGAHSAVQNPDGTPHIRHGRPDDRSFLFLKSKAEIVDDWEVLGLRGTGSDTYTVTDLFIPDAHAPARDAPEERTLQGALYGITSHLLYACGFSSVSLGVGRRMLETYTELARGKQGRASISLMARNNAVQKDIGRMEAQLSGARAFLHEAANEVYEASAAGTLTLDQRMRLRLATTHAMHEATEVSVACYRGAGTTAIMENAPFERRLRDALSVSQHLQGMPAHYEMVGRHILGTENVVQFL